MTWTDQPCFSKTRPALWTLRGREGIALVFVLWVLTLLSVIVGQFCYAMRSEVNIARNFKEETEAYYVAQAGIMRGIMELVRNIRIPQKPPPIGEKGEEAEEGEEEEPRWRVNVQNPSVAFGAGQFQVRIGNESGKVDLNKANERMLNGMLNGFDLSDGEKGIMVDSILDWRDPDDFHRLNGAENAYYKSLPEPYECKNADFDTVEELLLVRGVTPEIFFGGLKDMVTVLPVTSGVLRSKAAMGQTGTQININAASPQLLRSLPYMTDDLVQAIVQYRKGKDILSVAELALVVGTDVANAIAPFLTFTLSSYYTLTSVGTLEGSPTRQVVEVLVQIDVGLKKGYRILQWMDSKEYSG